VEVIMKVALDGTAPIRPGEELPLERLQGYLRQQFPEASRPLAVEQFPHGHSNLTYLLRLGERELVLRRPPFGNPVKTAHDMGREYRVLSGLWAVYPAAPRPFCYCEDEAILGAPFYVMERRHGVVLRQANALGSTADPAMARRLGIALIDNLARLHRLDYRSAGLGDLGKPDGYVARQVTGWINRYAAAQTDKLPSAELVGRWLCEHIPPESGAALIHNDYKFDNLLLAPDDLTRIVAVLDWEMTTVGDPLMDLGTTLGYWVEAGDAAEFQAAAMGPTNLPGSLTRRELVERYAEAAGRDVADVVFFYCFGLFKIATIVQQIYARFVRGHTHDPRFARLNGLVVVLFRQADRTLEADRL
jgi:aminoglycoside phosphotransferase (APT) family kinase protein